MGGADARPPIWARGSRSPGWPTTRTTCWCCSRTGQDIRKFNTGTNSLTVWRSGEKGQVGAGYKGQLVYAPRTANAQEELRLSGTRWNGNAVTHLRYLDSPILTMALFNGRVAIATRTQPLPDGRRALPRRSRTTPR